MQLGGMIKRILLPHAKDTISFGIPNSSIQRFRWIEHYRRRESVFPMPICSNTVKPLRFKRR